MQDEGRVVDVQPAPSSLSLRPPNLSLLLTRLRSLSKRVQRDERFPFTLATMSAVSPAASPALGPSPSPHLVHAAQAGKLSPRDALDASKQKDMSKGALPCPPSACPRRVSPSLTPTSPLPFPLAVVVRFKATGNAPIMKQNFYKITASNQFRTVIAFLRKELGWKPADSLVRCSLFRALSSRKTDSSLSAVPVHQLVVLARTR